VSTNPPAEGLAFIEVGEAIRTGMPLLASILGGAARRAPLVTLSGFTSGDWRGARYFRARVCLRRLGIHVASLFDPVPGGGTIHPECGSNRIPQLANATNATARAKLGAKRDSDDPTADPNLARKSDLVEPIAGGFVKSGSRQRANLHVLS